MAEGAPTTYRQKVATLEQSISQASQSVNAKERCLPMMLIVGAIFPLILATILFFWQPSIVQTKEGGKMVRSNKKLFYWTLGTTIVVWAAMYGYSYYTGHIAKMVCAR
jgi:hypothetical protein